MADTFLDIACPICGNRLRIPKKRGSVRATCSNGHSLQWDAPGGARSRWTRMHLIAAVALLLAMLLFILVDHARVRASNLVDHVVSALQH